MPDTRRRFRPGQAFPLEIDLRLVPDFEPPIAQRLADGYARRLTRRAFRRRLLLGYLALFLGLFLGQPLLFSAQGIGHGALYFVGQVLEGPRRVLGVLRF